MNEFAIDSLWKHLALLIYMYLLHIQDKTQLYFGAWLVMKQISADIFSFLSECVISQIK